MSLKRLDFKKRDITKAIDWYLMAGLIPPKSLVDALNRTLDAISNIPDASHDLGPNVLAFDPLKRRKPIFRRVYDNPCIIIDFIARKNKVI